MPRIFVVDDEEVIATTLALILKAHGYCATAFRDPYDLLEAAEKASPCLIISDVAMPGMNGIQLALRLRCQYPRCKILLFSGQAATSDLLAAVPVDQERLEIIAKPVHPETLLRRIRDLTER